MDIATCSGEEFERSVADGVPLQSVVVDGSVRIPVLGDELVVRNVTFKHRLTIEGATDRKMSFTNCAFNGVVDIRPPVHANISVARSLCNVLNLSGLVFEPRSDFHWFGGSIRKVLAPGLRLSARASLRLVGPQENEENYKSLAHAIELEHLNFQDAQLLGEFLIMRGRVTTLDMTNAEFVGPFQILYSEADSLYFGATALKNIDGPFTLDCVIHGDSSFRNRRFCSISNLQNSTFAVAPDFLGAQLEGNVEFPGRESFFDRTSPHCVERYRYLRKTATNSGSRRDEAAFFALEQEAARKQRSTPWLDAKMGYLYGLCSDYGHSVTRPLVSLVVLWLVCTVMYAILASPGWNEPIDWGIVARAAVESLQQTAKPYSSSEVYALGDISPGMSMWAHVLSILHSIAAVVCYVFLALGLRWLFQRQ